LGIPKNPKKPLKQEKYRFINSLHSIEGPFREIDNEWRYIKKKGRD